MMFRKGLALALLMVGATICTVRSEVCKTADIGVDLTMSKNGQQLAEPEFSGPGAYTISCNRPCACAEDCLGATCPQGATPPGFQVCAKAYAICVDWEGVCTGYEADGNFHYDLSVTFPEKPPANVQRDGPPMGIGAVTISPCEGSLFKCAATPPGACSLGSCKCCEPSCFVDV